MTSKKFAHGITGSEALNFDVKGQVCCMKGDFRIHTIAKGIWILGSNFNLIRWPYFLMSFQKIQ